MWPVSLHTGITMGVAIVVVVATPHGAPAMSRDVAAR